MAYTVKTVHWIVAAGLLETTDKVVDNNTGTFVVKNFGPGTVNLDQLGGGAGGPNEDILPGQDVSFTGIKGALVISIVKKGDKETQLAHGYVQQ